ncbi:hypothetical protein Zm00014a_041060 [Zea mays]|uniref:Uncharacterized protein n=1 Tax=Zea mays TaxID=4577 RepID=A0A3L6FZR9_MAIZE|nr:hypothetical protein Zm00014a_041060 [Zea mays]
MGMWSHIV